MKAFLKSNDTVYQLFPTNYHRINSVDCAITTFRDHLIDGISSADSNFPIHLWDRIIPQAKKILNMIRQSKLSADAQLHAVHNCNKEPLAPPGTNVLIHDTSENRRI